VADAVEAGAAAVTELVEDVRAPPRGRETRGADVGVLAVLGVIFLVLAVLMVLVLVVAGIASASDIRRYLSIRRM
jgi:hypothetical protein